MAKKRRNQDDVGDGPGRKRGKRVRIPAVPPPPAGETAVEVVEFCGCTNDQLERGTSCGLPQCPNMAGFLKPAGIVHPIAEGMRVHHVAGIGTKGRPDRGGPYWGRVVQVIELPNGVYEYDVMPDASHSKSGRPFLTVWEEHHIDEVLEGG